MGAFGRTGWILALVAALTPTACGSSPPERTCQRSAGAEVCLVASDKAYSVEANGLRPGSELVVVGDGNSEAPLVFAADDEGAAPSAGGTAGILLGAEPQRFIVTGRSATGSDVRLEFQVPAASG